MDEETPKREEEVEAGPAEVIEEIPRPKAMPGKRVIKLLSSIMVDGEETWFLQMPRKVVMGDLMAIDNGKGDVEKAILLIAKLAKIPFASAKAIDAKDIQEESELGGYVNDFLLKSPGIGGP
jgi:hypothetical protein